MTDMMTTTGTVEMGSSIIWLHIHWFFGAFAIAGFILLIAWAIKNLSGGAQKSLIILLLLVGIAGTLLTAIPAATGFQQMAKTWQGGGMKHCPMMTQMMETMMEHDKEGHSEMREMMESMGSPQMEMMMEESDEEANGSMEHMMMDQ